jgi:HD-GYP domain-containing protein (c-di-GMP phosphodiesterase class II)
VDPLGSVFEPPDEGQSPTDVAVKYLGSLMGLSGMEAAGIYLRDELSGKMAPLAICGSPNAATVAVWSRLVSRTSKSRAPLDRGALVALPLKRPSLDGVLVVQGLGTNRKRAAMKRLLQTVASRTAMALNHARLAQKYAQKIIRIQQLEEVSQILNAPVGARETLRRALEAATTLVDAEAGALLLRDDQRGDLYFEEAVGDKRVLLKELRVQVGRGVAGLVARDGEPLVVNDAQQDPRVDPEIDKLTGFTTYSVLCVPIRVGPRILGVLEAVNKKQRRPFSKWDMVELGSLSHQMAIALENGRLFREYQSKIKRLQKTQEISAVLNSSLNQAEIRKRAIEAATVLMDAEAGSLLLLDEPAGELYFEVALGEKGEGVRQVRLKIGEGIAGHVAKTGQPIIVNDVQNDPRFAGYVDKRSGFVTRNMVCVPVKARETLLGVLQAINKQGGRAFGEEDLQDFVSFGHQVGIAIENANLYEEINRLFEGFISASVTAIESRDPTTSGHSERVARLTCGLARSIDHLEHGPFADVRFTADQMKEIRYAAVLHDFGKVGVRENILVKAQKLFPGDLQLLKARFDFIKRTLEARALRRKVDALLSGDRDAAAAVLAEADEELAARVAETDGILEFLLMCNQPTVLPKDGFERLHHIANMSYDALSGEQKPYLTPDEVMKLSIPRGSLTTEERVEIESHVTHTYRFLSTIPWTKTLKNVPIIAYGHHEKLDGTGYPRQVPGSTIPVQTRMMTISDIYDALTASDRPYKASVPPRKALDILENEVQHGKVDRDLFTIFVDAKIYTLTA